SAIAIVNEIRARGPLTQTVMGVTIISDVLVIVIFGLNLEIAEALLTDVSFNLGFALLLLFELLFAMVMGIILAYILKLILTLHMDGRIKIILILATGYAIFALSTLLHDNSHDYLNITLTLEPLLVCMIAGFWVTNRTNYRAEFLKLLEEVAPIVYIIFFTLTGASLALDVLAATWHIALALFAVRLLGIFIGAFSGGVIARDPMKFNRVSWLTYVTMAGVSLGLAKEVADKFPTWGPELATIIIAVIVLNQIVGPPMFKWALNRVGEAHPRHEKSAFDGVRDAIIFGIDGQAVALSRQLVAHGWQVKTACLDTQLLGTGTAVSDLHIHPINNFSIDTLRALNAENADAIVTLLSDDENYQICETAYEHLGTEILVVRLNNRANFDRFHRLGALIVDPATVMVGLLDHFVRSPSAASLLLGMDEGQDVVDVEVRNKDLHGITLRELRLPLDTLIMSVQRDGHAIISHGYTELHYGDRITVVGSVDSLEEIFLRFDEQI
ncbi:MAG: cation:proton antiporter, partial [Anaerolineales bacterium]|nr:cation:proton antiporter [Anaerolineales bacterium]